MTERWLPIPSFEGRYEISDQGRVRSLLFRSNGGPEIMTSTPNYAGYHVIMLGVDRKQYRLHCLVLETFVGPRPDGMQGCHNDNNKDNNHLGNLRWDTPKGNIADRRRYFGEDSPAAKIINVQRQEIIDKRAAGIRSKDLAAEYGLTQTRVCQIVKVAKRAL